MKFRVIDTQKEFEEIVHKFKQEPFDCSKQANCRCDYPTDIEYDSSQTWVKYKPNIPKIPNGFKRISLLREDYSKLDSYYITPTSKQLRSRNEIAAYLKDHPQLNGVSSLEFDFSSAEVIQDTVPEFVVKQKDSVKKKAKIAKDEV